ncbi:retrovirus-related pol polyprotein from transposon TNT 1-94 [Tanacetum coccineum]
MLTKPQVFYDNTHKQALGYQNPFHLKKSQWIKLTLYDGSVISSQHAACPVIDDKETLILEEVSRSKMLAKQNDPMSKEKKVNTTPINYVELNRLSKDFGKHFVPQQELSDEQAFWLQTSYPNTDQSTLSPVKIEAPRELPMRITPDAITEAVMICVIHSTIVFDAVNVEMQSSESCVKCLSLDAEILNKQNAYNDLSKKYFENNDLKAHLQAKDTTICKLKEHIKSMRENDKEEKVKQHMGEIETINIKLEHKTVENAAKIPIATTIAPDKFKIELEPLAPRLLKNREAHIDYLKHTQEQADILQGIVEQAKTKHPLDNALDFACSSKKAKIVESMFANNSEPNHLWGSNATDVPSSSFVINDRLSRLFSGFRDTNLYTISLDDMLKTSSICLLSKASMTKSWLWYRRLSHLNFGTLNKLAKDGLARGIPKLKFQKDHLCSACAFGKSKKSSHQPKAEDTNQEKLYLLHIDLCGLMRVESINEKKYILVIVDNYSRFTWVKILRSKD